MPSGNQAPTGPYHAGPGTAHEIGVMIGFMAAFVLITIVYLVMWKIGNRRGEAKERQRRQMLAEKTQSSKPMVMENEKARDRIGVAQGY